MKYFFFDRRMKTAYYGNRLARPRIFPILRFQDDVARAGFRAKKAMLSGGTSTLVIR